MSENDKQIGLRLKTVRKEAGLTQQQLAKRLGIPYQSVGQWERGIRNPKIETLQAIADAIGVSLDYLLGNVNDPFFVLDTEKIKADINSYEKDPEPSQTARPEVSEDDIKFALFGGAGEITDEMYEEVKEFVRFVKMKHGQE
jgi:transcriptional regulator with XRE-family HTH domain